MFAADIEKKVVELAKSGVPPEKIEHKSKEELALEYIMNEDNYSEEEKKRLQGELMAHISEEAVTCEECHHDKGYIDFAALGYTPIVVENLSHISIVKLSKEYEEFHLPTMFDPCVVKGQEDVN